MHPWTDLPPAEDPVPQPPARLRLSRRTLEVGGVVALVTLTVAILLFSISPLAGAFVSRSAHQATNTPASPTWTLGPTFPPYQAPTATLQATPTNAPFVCANAPGATAIYAFVNNDRQIYRVMGCGAPFRLTTFGLDTFAQPIAFSPTNRWLMTTFSQQIDANTYQDCQILINPQTAAQVKTPFCVNAWGAWSEWPAFVAWLDDSVFLESLTQPDKSVKIVTVNATTFAKTPVATLSWVGDRAIATTTQSGIEVRRGYLYYAGVGTPGGTDGWLRQVPQVGGADIRIVPLGVAGPGGCQVGSSPCQWTGPFDVSPDGSHIAYYKPGPTKLPNDYGDVDSTPPLYYAKSDGSSPVQLLPAPGPGTSGFPPPMFSPDGASIAVSQFPSPIVKPLAGGVIVTLPSHSAVLRWRPDSKAVIVILPDEQGTTALIDVATGASKSLPGQAYSYVWGA